VVVQKLHPDAFRDTSLPQELASRGIQHLIISGIQTEYCIDATCRRAYSLGYEVVLVKDAHSTWDTDHLTARQIIDHHNNVLGGWFAELREASEIEFDDVYSNVSQRSGREGLLHPSTCSVSSCHAQWGLWHSRAGSVAGLRRLLES
jgi:hypothetical protein